MQNTNELIHLLENQEHKSDAITTNLAELYIESGDYPAAESLLKGLISRNPDSEEIKSLLATTYFYQAKNSVAAVIVEDLLSLESPTAETHLLGALVTEKTGSKTDAAELYQKAVEKNPNLANRDLDTLFSVFSSNTLSGSYDDEEKELVELENGMDWQDDGIPFGPNDTDEDESQRDFMLEKSDISFKDVGGMSSVKEEVSLKIIHPLEHPDLYQAYGKEIGGGILMYGPPGCGKTHLARATAGEVNASFLSIGINDVLDMYLGQSEKKLHALFELARENRPTVLFFDEVDALGAKRSDMKQSAGRHLINQFLSELDGIKADNEGILTLAATNTPWHLDAAFRRPGRFDRIIFIPPPDQEARVAILDLLLQEKPMTEKVDTVAIAKKTKDFSGADLKSLIDITIEEKLKEAMKKGAPQPITTKDLLKAVKRVRPSVKEWFETAKNYALYSNQTGLYDDILDYLKIKR